MVWACILYKEVGRLHLIQWSLNIGAYLSITKVSLLRRMRDYFGQSSIYIFTEDCDPWHWIKQIRSDLCIEIAGISVRRYHFDTSAFKQHWKWLARQLIMALMWPSISRKINTIQNFWHNIVSLVDKKTKTLSEHQVAIIYALGSGISLKCIHNIVLFLCLIVVLQLYGPRRRDRRGLIKC